MSRIHSIDYLRGILSLIITFYHYKNMTYGKLDPNFLLEKLGIYGVAAFYVISGISLSLAYENKNWAKIQTVSSFIFKRFFRIFPVFFISCNLVIAFYFYQNPSYKIDWLKYFYNISLTFSFLDRTAYLMMGGWSIGNEIVFYFSFPFLISLFESRWKLFFVCILVLIFLVYFGFFALQGQTLGDVWETYIHPLNQIFFFTSGILLVYLRKYLKNVTQFPLVIGAIISFLAFYLYPIEDDELGLVTGYNRIILSFLTVKFCLCIMLINCSYKIFVENILKFLADISYSLYLFHGIFAVFFLYTFNFFLMDSAPGNKFIFLSLTAFPLTILFSYMIYKFIEKPIMIWVHSRYR